MSAVSIPTPITRAISRTIACGPSPGACSIRSRRAPRKCPTVALGGMGKFRGRHRHAAAGKTISIEKPASNSRGLRNISTGWRRLSRSRRKRSSHGWVFGWMNSPQRAAIEGKIVGKIPCPQSFSPRLNASPPDGPVRQLSEAATLDLSAPINAPARAKQTPCDRRRGRQGPAMAGHQLRQRL